MWDLMQRGGLLVMIPLAVCSIVALGFVVERAVFWIRLHKASRKESAEQFLDAAMKGNLERAKELSQGSADPVLRVLSCGLAHRQYDSSSALEMAASAEMERAERFLPVLDTIITLSPLLGILGTVVGIIQSFDMLSQTAVLEDPQAVTGGIAQALITTATGLTIAISSLIPHNFFRSRADLLRHRLEEAATRLEIVIGRTEPEPRERRPREEGVPVRDEMNWA